MPRSSRNPYYSDRIPWYACWPLSRVVRYLVTFLFGALTGAGLVAGATDRRATSHGGAAIDRSYILSATTAYRAPAENRGLEEVTRTATRPDLDEIKRRVVALETSREASDQAVQEKDSPPKNSLGS